MPVSVELVRSIESPQRNIIKNVSKTEPRQSKIEKNISPVKNWDSGPIHPPTQARSHLNQKPDKPFSRGQLVSFTKTPAPSAKTWNRAPVYPESARRLGREGRVILDAELDNFGRVVSVQVAHSSGSADLDQAAIEAVQEWTMDLPKDGSRRLFIPITFRFNSNS